MHAAIRRPPVSLWSHGLLVLTSLLAYLLLLTALRALLLGMNNDLLHGEGVLVIAQSFVNGWRFDLRLAMFVFTPLLLAFVSAKLIQYRGFFVAWLSTLSAVSIFLSVVELNFYQEFHQRLNSIFFQYLSEDPKTVISMLWYGFPVIKLLTVCALITAYMVYIYRVIERKTRVESAQNTTAIAHILVFTVILLVAVVAARGTLRQGPPLRWGDAFTTHSLFLNHLGLNPVLTLVDAARNTFSTHRNHQWKATMPEADALAHVRQMILTPQDTLVDEDTAAVRRISHPPAKQLNINNVVVILMESFAGRYTGALGGEGDITPYFDALTKQGLLFTQFFANGTHTHQGMFATMACFPNLPAFEYLMQTPEGGNQFSGLPQLLNKKAFQNVYVYNGDFAWDNQQGFFGNQGMTRFIGRKEYKNPVFSDPTWGVSDQDMFTRSISELNNMARDKPFYALLQTLSNHTPYALPTPLPVEEVTGFNRLDEHLTAMRYADWALGQFFAQAKQQAWYDNTLFVILGDHGFGAPNQLTEMDLYRHYVPLLLIAPGIQQWYGATRNTVASQVDVVPTILGLLGVETQHQCWGRDLLHLPPQDGGFAVIKPSGDDQTVAIVTNQQVIIKPPSIEARAWAFDVAKQTAEPVAMDDKKQALLTQLYSYLQVATQSLLANTTGDE